MGEVAKEVLEFARYIEDHYPDQDPPADDPVVKKLEKKISLEKNHCESVQKSKKY